MESKRITVFAGHYGSGKTNIAVNYALYLRRMNPEKKVTVADLDIVNPYFRTRDSMDVMESNRIKLISSEFANSNVDLPALPPDTYSIFDDRECLGVVDVGGDDRGALALGRYTDKILADGDYAFLFVINKFRPLTATAEGAVEIMREIEFAAHMRFTGIVNNSNIGNETTEENVLFSAEYAEEVSKITGLPVVMTAVKQSLFEPLCGKINNLFPITLYVEQSWEKN